MDSRIKKGNIPMLICSFLVFVILLVLYFLWNYEPAPGDRWKTTLSVARTLLPPLMCVFGTAWVFYALEWGGLVRVRRSLAGGIVVAAIILIVWALIILALYKFAFAPSGETMIAGSYPGLLGKLFGVYIYWFD